MSHCAPATHPPVLGVSRGAVFLLLFCVFLGPIPFSRAEEEDDDNLLEMSLEELLNVEVTSVSRRAEKRTEAAAAIFVLTTEDIRSSGARSIPDLLRLVPGVNVAQLNSSIWSVTARGFGGRFANKLLVLIDGRSIYTPLFSGVYWEAHDVMIEDVDRIEVIRGPGGTLWGANAVNGVINIVTKHAADTQGGLLTVGAGSEERGFGAFRYGGTLKESAHYRVYGKYFNRDEGGTTSIGDDARDDWNAGQGGFRVDWDLGVDDTLTLQGDLVELSQHQMIDTPMLADPFSALIDSETEYSGRNVLGRWARTISDTQDLKLQFYYDYYDSSDGTFSEERHTVDLDFQHSFEVGSRQRFMWGAGFRYTHDEIENSDSIMFLPDSRGDELFSAFIQDQISLTEELRLTLGTKFEHNSYTGFEIQPSARLAWTPNESHTLWAAVSRAVRTPSRAEADIHLLNSVSEEALFTPSLTAIVLEGSDAYGAEELLSYEIGYRVSPTERLAFDIATFYNRYDSLRSIEFDSFFVEDDPAPEHTVLAFSATNEGEATAYGIELVMDWKISPRWQMHGTYSFSRLEVRVPVSDSLSEVSEGDTPEHQATLVNRFDLPHSLEVDATLRYVGELEILDIEIDDYVELDLRLAWSPKENLELALVGRNLLDSEHIEFSPTFVSQMPSSVERSVYGLLTWRF